VADVICPDEVIIVRYVHSLTDDQRELLEQTMQAEPSFRARARAHSLLLSDQGTSIKDIAKTSHVDRDTVSSWITTWEHQGAQSLHDKPRSGRPSTLTPDEQALAQQ
jgi:transposase